MGSTVGAKKIDVVLLKKGRRAVKESKIYVADSKNGRRVITYFSLNGTSGLFGNPKGKPIAARVELGSVGSWLLQLLGMLQKLKVTNERLHVPELANVKPRGARRLSPRWVALQQRAYQGYRARFSSATQTPRTTLGAGGSYVAVKDSGVLAVSLNDARTHMEFSSDVLQLDLLAELIPMIMSDELVMKADPRFGLDFLIPGSSVWAVGTHYPIATTEHVSKAPQSTDLEALKKEVIRELTLEDLPPSVRAALIAQAQSELPPTPLTGDAADLQAWEKRLIAESQNLKSERTELNAFRLEAAKEVWGTAARMLAAIETHDAAIPPTRKAGLMAIRAEEENYNRRHRA